MRSVFLPVEIWGRKSKTWVVRQGSSDSHRVHCFSYSSRGKQRYDTLRTCLQAGTEALQYLHVQKYIHFTIWKWLYIKHVIGAWRETEAKQADGSGNGKLKCLPISSTQTLWTRWIRELTVNKASHCQTLRQRSIIQMFRDDSHQATLRLLRWQRGCDTHGHTMLPEA